MPSRKLSRGRSKENTSTLKYPSLVLSAECQKSFWTTRLDGRDDRLRTVQYRWAKRGSKYYLSRLLSAIETVTCYWHIVWWINVPLLWWWGNTVRFSPKNYHCTMAVQPESADDKLGCCRLQMHIHDPLWYWIVLWTRGDVWVSDLLRHLDKYQ